MEKAGASLAVIIDNKSNEDVKNVIMSDDGTGTGIRIPAMLISRKDGDKLVEFLKNQESLSRKASLSAEFVMENPENKVTWSLWYTSQSDKSLDFLRNFKENNDKYLKGDATFIPHIVTWSCTSCDSEFKQNECVSNGKYCAMNHQQSEYIKGKDIIMEDLR